MSQIKLFPCTFCKELVAADAKKCPVCSTPVDAAAAQLAADTQLMENRRIRQKQYARHMKIGGGLLALGIAITVGTYTVAEFSEEGGSYVITYGLMLSGGLDFLYGLAGWLGELK